MQQVRCEPAQALVNKAIRVMVHRTEKDRGVRVAAMWRELNIPPVHAEASARRARALVKFPNLKTWIGVLSRYPYSSRQSLWYDGGLKWMRQHCSGVDSTGVGKPCENYIARAKRVYEDVLASVWESHETKPRFGASLSYI